MSGLTDPHVLQVPTTRALAELRSRRQWGEVDYERLRKIIPGLGLDGAPFDDNSRVYPLEIPPAPRVVVLADDPRLVSVGLRDNRGQFVGVVGDAAFEVACKKHPDGLLYAVGNIVERRKGEKVYLNLCPRGWVVVAENGVPATGEDTNDPPVKRNRSRGNRRHNSRK